MAVNGAAYVAFDVDRIKEYVFAGHRPVDATGASELVKSLEEGDLLTSWLQGFGAEVIYARGGSGLLRVEDGSRAGELAGHLESQFRFRTRTASCSAVWIDANRGRGGGAFSETFRRLGVLLQRRKAEKAGEEPAEAWSMGYVARCDACGGQPAAWQDAGPSEEWLCESCRTKRETGRRQKSGSMAQDMHEITGQRDEGGYVACLYADVDRAGGLLQLCGSEAEAKGLSRHLYQAVIEKGIVPVQRRFPGRYQSPIVGGDDLVAFMPAQGCTDVAIQVWQSVEAALKNVNGKFEQGSEVGRKLEKEVSLSLGLLVASATLPIPFLFEMASALLKSAKARSYETGASAIDFLMLKGGTPLSESIRDVRRASLTRQIDRGTFPKDGSAEAIEEIHLTRRPYCQQQFIELRKQAEGLRSQSEVRGQLQQIASLLETARPMEIYAHSRYQKARSAAMAGVPDDLLHSVKTVEGRQCLTSGVFDLLELAEMNAL